MTSESGLTTPARVQCAVSLSVIEQTTVGILKLCEGFNVTGLSLVVLQQPAHRQKKINETLSLNLSKLITDSKIIMPSASFE